jgi:hypothetical protein
MNEKELPYIQILKVLMNSQMAKLRPIANLEYGRSNRFLTLICNIRDSVARSKAGYDLGGEPPLNIWIHILVGRDEFLEDS